jgi:ParB family chromosome partitioning protein
MTAHVQTGSKGGGKLTLHFASPDELQGLLQRLGIQL